MGKCHAERMNAPNKISPREEPKQSEGGGEAKTQTIADKVSYGAIFTPNREWPHQ
jgi:hypothetical protein